MVVLIKTNYITQAKQGAVSDISVLCLFLSSYAISVCFVTLSTLCNSLGRKI